MRVPHPPKRTARPSMRSRHRSVAVEVALFALLAGTLLGCADPWRNVQPVDTEPVQTDYDTYPSWQHQGFLLEAVAGYEIEAVVLSTHSYRFARFGRAVPLDLALGWGPMSRPEVLRELDIAQRYRWYIYSWNDPPPISEEAMREHSANVHIVPADRSVYRQVLRLDPGDRVRMTGRLVNVSNDSGEMRTSRSRSDRAGGACEIMYVETVEQF